MKMVQRRWILLTVILGVFGASGSLSQAVEKRPNVLFLFSDDQRADTIGALGNKYIHTPTLDRLVREGTTFTRNYCLGSNSGAVCYPSRAMVLTGVNYFRLSKNSTGGKWDRARIDRWPIWPEVMKQAGYVTFGTGKWHNGQAAFQRGFTHGDAVFLGGMSNHNKVPVHTLQGSGETTKLVKSVRRKFSSELFADAAVTFLGKHDGKQPFFMYVSFTAPHDPRTPPGKYATMYDPAELPLPENYMPVHPFNNGEMVIRDERLAPWPRTATTVKQHLADYYGMISHMDAQMGRVLEALKAMGEYENTIIVMAGDHGLAIGSHGLLGKQNLYEHSMNTPLIIAGPGLPKNRRSDALTYLLDIFPTVCELTNLTIPKTVEGKSLAPLIRAEQSGVRETLFTAYRHVQRSVRDNRWKLILYPQINETQLFDLKSDPFELHSLTDEPSQASRIASLTAQMIDWQERLGDTQPLVSEKPQRRTIDLPSKKRQR